MPTEVCTKSPAPCQGKGPDVGYRPTSRVSCLDHALRISELHLNPHGSLKVALPKASSRFPTAGPPSENRIRVGASAGAGLLVQTSLPRDWKDEGKM